MIFFYLYTAIAILACLAYSGRAGFATIGRRRTMVVTDDGATVLEDS